MWTIRTKRTGSRIIMEDYKKVMIEKLLETDEPVGSSTLHQYLILTMNGKHPSRASVINFLNELVTYGYAKSNDTTGKGGHHNLYYTKLTKKAFKDKIVNDILNSLNKALVIAFN